MTDDEHDREPTQLDDAATLEEARRLMAVAEGHERRVALREESARFLEEKGEPEQAAIERREADLARDAARTAWDQALALQGPTQTTAQGLEIPIPPREAFIENLRRVAPKSKAPEQDKRPPQAAL